MNEPVTLDTRLNAESGEHEPYDVETEQPLGGVLWMARVKQQLILSVQCDARVDRSEGYLYLHPMLIIGDTKHFPCPIVSMNDQRPLKNLKHFILQGSPQKQQPITLQLDIHCERWVNLPLIEDWSGTMPQSIKTKLTR